MAASAPVIYQGTIVGVIRFVTSMSEVNRQFILGVTVVTLILVLRALQDSVLFDKIRIWHGTGWNFIVWGLLHTVYYIYADLKKNVGKYFLKIN